jgi:pantoate--beta-alanine ligase
MEVIRNIKKMQEVSSRLKKKGKTIALVPTMGALHEGHLSLIRQAGKENDSTVVSIFVNPIQFGPAEDFNRYPRPIKQDTYLCKKEKVDFIFYPKAQDMYPLGFKTYVEVDELQDVLCGASRLGHFRGVTTAVAKLFNIISPQNAYFGQKDAQQAIIIQRMARDLDMPVKIRIMPIVRAGNGLALSSRNIYLGKQQREEALSLSGSLEMARRLISYGEKSAAVIIAKIKDFIVSKTKSAKIEYISVVDLTDLKPVDNIAGSCLIALAVRIGKTRLIDNIIVKNNRKT